MWGRQSCLQPAFKPASAGPGKVRRSQGWLPTSEVVPDLRASISIQTMKKLIQKTLGLAGYALFNTRKQYGRDGLFTVHSDHFRYDPAFKAAYAQGIRAGGSFDPALEWRVHVAL